jgi:TIR domain
VTAIFLSYDRDDRARVRLLADALESEGFSVWWDTNIRIGRAFDDEIAHHLDQAKCVIAVWTTHSVRSQWVRSEASEAKTQGKLLPIKFDKDARIPLGFKLLQTADFSAWQPGTPHGGFTTLVERIREMCGASAVAVARQAREPFATVRTKRAELLLRFVALPSVVFVGAALGLMHWHIPTVVDAEFPVCSVRLAFSGKQEVDVLSTQNFLTLAFEGASRTEFAPSSVEQWGVSPANPCLTKAVVLGHKSVLHGTSFHLTVGAPKQRAGGQLQAVSIKPPNALIVELPDKLSKNTCVASAATPHETQVGGGFRLKFEGPGEAFRVAPQDTAYLDANNVTVEGAPCDPGPLRIASRLAEGDPFVKVVGADKGINLVLVPQQGSGALALLGPHRTQFAKVQVIMQGADGGPIAALAGVGLVKYPNLEGKPEARVAQDQRLIVENGAGSLRYDPESDSLRLFLLGRVEKLYGRSDVDQTDYRLTVFDRLRYGHLAAILFTIGTWVVPVTIGLFKLYREISK